MDATPEDAAESLRHLSEVTYWYFVDFLGPTLEPDEQLDQSADPDIGSPLEKDTARAPVSATAPTDQSDTFPGEHFENEQAGAEKRPRRYLFVGLAFVAAIACTTVLLALLWRSSPPQPRPPKPFQNSIGMEFVLIPSGGFRMGSPEDDELTREMEVPQHMVKISRPYYLGIHEVTQKQYAEIMGENPSYCSETSAGRSTDNYPVTNVTWSEAMEFCQKLSEREEQTYRLPTEAEWEYACRAGSSTRFPNGDAIEDLKRIAVVAGEDINPEHPIDVGCLEPNAFGLYDMLGNVREFCADWYGEYEPGLQVDPKGPDSGEKHVVRGGCYYFAWTDARCASRFPVEGPVPNAGFRVLLELRD
jgi:formylglycine-generating enzyme required for sulfatase activity